MLENLIMFEKPMTLRKLVKNPQIYKSILFFADAAGIMKNAAAPYQRSELGSFDGDRIKEHNRIV